MTGSFSGDFYAGFIDNPNNLLYGTGQPVVASFASGDNFALDSTGTYSASNGTTPTLILNDGYAGESLSSFMRFDGATFASLGITPGTYSSGWNNGADTITLEFGEHAPVPEPLTILGTVTALSFGSILKKKKRNQES